MGEFGGREPPLREVLDDPLIHLLMEKDGITPGQMRELMQHAARHLMARTPAKAPVIPGR